MRSSTATAGYVTVETVVLFPFFFFAFLTLVQLAYLEVACITTSHAAVTAARSAMVVLADDPKFYDSPVGSTRGERGALVTEAARIPLTTVAPDPRVDVSFPDRTFFREGDQVKVRVALAFPCTIPVGSAVLCTRGERRIVREATMPYQGAGYAYP